MATQLNPAIPLELERRLERQEAAIARLTALFPERADPIADARLHEILRALVEQAQVLFPGRTVTGTAAPLHDPETTAVHYLMLRVAGGREIEVTDFVERTFELLRHAADCLSPEEFEAVLISVE
ncbi:MAG TPA: hypothetical protein VFR81_07345 [Longimicrobium sp.]|nr:hypothetical protein [Longimicrobium sp.]